MGWRFIPVDTPFQLEFWRCSLSAGVQDFQLATLLAGVLKHVKTNGKIHSLTSWLSEVNYEIETLNANFIIANLGNKKLRKNNVHPATTELVQKTKKYSEKDGNFVPFVKTNRPYALLIVSKIIIRAVSHWTLLLLFKCLVYMSYLQ